MAIAYLASSYDDNSSVDSSTTSWSYDSLATGSDRVLVVFPIYENNTSADVTAVTYNGVSLTFQETYVDDGGGFAETIECWTLVNPATGSNTLAFTLAETGRDFGFSASVYTGVDQTTPVGNTAISGQYNSTTDINADLVFAANSMGVYCSSQNRSNTGPFSARTGNTQLGSYITATGNSGFEAATGHRGPESSAATYNCGSDATTNSIGGGCVAIELLEATAGGDTNVNASTEALTITENAATITLDVNVAASTESLTLTEYQATVGYVPSVDVDVLANPEALTITEHQASITLGVNVSASTESLVLTGHTAQVELDVNVQASTEALTITSYQAVIDVGGQTNVQASTEALVITPQPASIGRNVNVGASVEALTLTTNAASVQLGSNVLASIASLTITEQPATITYDVGVEASPESLTIETHAANIESQGATTLTPQDITNIVDALFAKVVENGETFEQQLKLIRAEAAGKVAVSGNTVSFRDAADSKDRIVATVDEQGQRTAITTDVS